jgi:hypothetical protein
MNKAPFPHYQSAVRQRQVKADGDTLKKVYGW